MIELRTLGEFTVWIAGEPRRLATDKQSALLVYLAVHQGRTLRREHLANLLWEGSSTARARQSLSQALYEIRGRLPELEIETNREEVWLAEGALAVDARSFRAAAASQQFEKAAGHYRGDFLDGYWVSEARAFEEWQLAEREELSRLARQVLHRLLRDAEAGGDWLRVTQLATDLLKLDSFNEAVYRARIQAIAANEGRRQGLEEYDRVVEFIATELNREPEPATKALGATLAEELVSALSWDDDSMEELHWTPFYGRQEEFGRLRAEWELVRAGVGRAVVVSGEPGIGKTRLCDQFLRLCAIQGGRIFQGSCHTTDRHVPYSGIINSLLGSIRAADISALPAEWSAILSRVLPEIRSLTPGLASDSPLEGEGARRRLFEGFAQFFQVASKESPVVLHIDDFQWCDESSAALMHYIVRRLARAPVLILLSMRPEGEESHMSAELLAVGEGTSQGYDQIDIEPLGYEVVEQIIHTFAERQMIQLPESIRREIYAQTGGRPFFIIEILRAILQGELEWDQGESGSQSYGSPAILLPPTVEEFLNRSMRGLGKDARPVIATLAVLGTHADTQLVGEVAAVGPRRFIRGVEELSARGLIKESDTEISFSHALIREAAYRSISKSRRRLLHSAAGDALRKRGDVLVAVLCTHYDAAGVSDLARNYALLASEESSRVHGHLETEFFLRMALSNTDDVQSMATIKERLGALLLSLRRYAEAERLLADVAAMDVVAGDHRRLLAIETQLLTIALKQGDLPPDSLLQRIAELVARADAYGEQRIHIDLLSALAIISHSIGQRDLVLDAVEQLSRLADTVNQAESEVTALTTVANVIGMYKGIPTALQYADEAVQRASRIKDGRFAIKALCSRAVNRMQAGMLTLAESDFTTALQFVETFAAVSQQQFAMSQYAIMLLERGDYSQARDILLDAVKMTITYNAVLDQVVVTGNMLLAEFESGNHEAAAALAAEVLTLSQRAPFLWCMIGAWSILGLYALERGDLDLAHEYRREILTHSEGQNLWVSDASYAEIFFARLTAMEGNAEAALARLDKAIAAYTDRDIFCRSRLQIERARLLVTRDPAAAGRQAAEVRARGREIGARPLVEKADLILDQLPDLSPT